MDSSLASTAAVTAEQHSPDEAATFADRQERHRWYWPLLILLCAITGGAYLWRLGQSGWSNGFYSAAVQAGSVSWKAFFFGSFDGANAITVDKPPASLWVMALSARVFGVNTWSILVPEIMMGIGTMVIVASAVRRWFGDHAALVAAAIVATTPVAVLMFRFNNPDALLVLLMTAAAYWVCRAIEDGKTRWLVFAGCALGIAFLTKMLQAYVVVPPLAIAFFFSGPGKWVRRFWQTTIFGLVTLAASAWWVAIVELWPKSSRPYIGGSQKNSVVELIFGYNGLGRLTGDEVGSVGPTNAASAALDLPGAAGRLPGGPPGAGGGSRWGQTGWLRMFGTDFGGQASWLMPTALAILVLGLVFTVRRGRTDRTRAALIVWGGWLVLTAVLFSLSKGIIHTYYAVALVPATAALCGIGFGWVWSNRQRVVGALMGSTLTVLTAWWAIVLLRRTPDYAPALPIAIGAVAAFSVVMWWSTVAVRQMAIASALTAGFVAFGGPVAYSINTLKAPHTGSLPTAGPSGLGAFGGPGGIFGNIPGPPPGAGINGAFPGVPPTGGQVPGQLPGQGTGANSGAASTGGRAQAGGLLRTSEPSAAIVAYLSKDATKYRWMAAAPGSNSAAGYQLAASYPVWSLGGFNGSDPSPTLDEFKSHVAKQHIHFFIAGGGGPGGGPGAGGPGGFGPGNVGPGVGLPGAVGGATGGAYTGVLGTQNGGSRAAAEISAWVQASFDSTTVDGIEIFDLTKPRSNAG